MLGRDILTVLFRLLQPTPSPRRNFLRDAAHLFIPFALATFLLLLGGALLATWGRLSRGVLVGFCAAAGVLVGLFLLCHLALYCARTGAAAADGSDDPGSVGKPVPTPMVCPRCFGGVPRMNVFAPYDGNRNTDQVSHGY